MGAAPFGPVSILTVIAVPRLYRGTNDNRTVIADKYEQTGLPVW
jgi:hypothetical protein